MRKKTLIFLFLLTFITEITITTILFNKTSSVKQDTLEVNECLKTIEENYNSKNYYYKGLDYTFVDNNDSIIYKSTNSKTNSLNDAIKNNDIILDVKVDNLVVGKVYIKNNTEELINKYKRTLFIIIIVISVIQLLLIIG